MVLKKPRTPKKPKAPYNPRAPKAVDIFVGSRIRLWRMRREMTQEQLGKILKVAYQQIQKYEKGVNRVGASRLQQFSDALGVPPSYFFEGAPTVGKKQPAPQEGELSENDIVSFLGTREGAALVRAFMAIKQKPIRQTAIVFLETLKGK